MEEQELRSGSIALNLREILCETVRKTTVCTLRNSSQNTTNKRTNVKVIFFTHNLSQLRDVSICVDHLQGVTEHQ